MGLQPSSLQKGQSSLCRCRKEVLTLEQILPCLVVLDFGTQTSSLALVIEIGSKDGSLISIDGDKTIDRTPEAITINRDNILIFTVYLTAEQGKFALLGILTIQLKTSINATLLTSLNYLTISIDKSSATIIFFQSSTASSLLILRS